MSYKEVNKEEALALLRRPGSEGGMSYRDSPRSSSTGQQQQQGSDASHVASTAKEEEHSGKSKALLTSANVKHSLLPAIIYGEACGCALDANNLQESVLGRVAHYT
jgi:hypothetical protein